MTKSNDVQDGERWLLANNAVEVVSLWYREPFFVAVLRDGSSVTVSERVPSAKGAYLEVSSKLESETRPEVVEACLVLIRSAPYCEDESDFLAEAIALSRRL